MRLLCLAISFLTFIAASGCQKDDPQRQRIDRLVANIDDLGGWTSGKINRTPAVYELIDIGLPVIPAVLPLMLADDSLTRDRASTVLLEVTMVEFGWVPGQGWPNDTARLDHVAFWRSLGSLDSDADATSREASVKLWRAWLADGMVRRKFWIASRTTHAGFGIVEGLRHTGDEPDYKPLARATTPADAQLRAERRLAIVQVFLKESDTPNGPTRRVTVQTMGDATSLAGGRLRITCVQPVTIIPPADKNHALLVGGDITIDSADDLATGSVPMPPMLTGSDAELMLRMRIAVARQNIANADTIADRFGRNRPYRRHYVEPGKTGAVVKVDMSPYPRKHDPTHPMADDEGYVKLSNVDIVWELSVIEQAIEQLGGRGE